MKSKFCLHVDLDDETAIGYARRGSSIFGTLFIEVDGKFFPEQDWQDFVAVVLTGWIDRLVILHRLGGMEENHFMDGPVHFVTKTGSDGITLEFPGSELNPITLEPSKYARTLLRAASKVLNRVEQLPIDMPPDARALRKMCDFLRTFLPELDSARPRA